MSLEYEILDLGLVYYKNAIPNPQYIIDVINSIDNRFLSNEHEDKFTQVKPWTPWSYGNTIFNYQKFFPEPGDVSDSDYYSKEIKDVSSILYASLDRALAHYKTEVYPFADKNIKSREHSIHLLRYDVGGHLPAHQDQGISSRILSSVMYLNDDYDGGEIEFKNSGVKIKPEAGSIIFFPSNFLYVHEVYPITNGSRYSMPHWFHNMAKLVESNGSE